MSAVSGRCSGKALRGFGSWPLVLSCCIKFGSLHRAAGMSLNGRPVIADIYTYTHASLHTHIHTYTHTHTHTHKHIHTHTLIHTCAAKSGEVVLRSSHYDRNPASRKWRLSYFPLMSYSLHFNRGRGLSHGIRWIWKRPRHFQNSPKSVFLPRWKGDKREREIWSCVNTRNIHCYRSFKSASYIITFSSYSLFG